MQQSIQCLLVIFARANDCYYHWGSSYLYRTHFPCAPVKLWLFLSSSSRALGCSFFLSNHFCHLKLSRAVATAGKKENNTLKWLYYRIVLRVSLIYCLFVPCLFDDDNHVPLAYTAAAVAIYLITPLSLLPSIYIYIYIYDFDDYIKIAARYMNTSSLFG